MAPIAVVAARSRPRPGSEAFGVLPYAVVVESPEHGSDWLALGAAPLPVAAAASWVVDPSCGAVVTFSGHARDHSPGRDGVERLHYEAYEGEVIPRFALVVAELRRRWPDVGKVAMLHRVGDLDVTDVAVVVAVSAPHRDVAFDAARFGIDELKATAPIWKRETWRGGEDWGLDATSPGGVAVQ